MSPAQGWTAMRSEYDSRANALAIDLVPQDELHADDTVDLRGNCHVALNPADRPVSVEVLGPGADLDEVLGGAAERFGLDHEALVAAAHAALAAPDRPVTLEVGPRAAPERA